MNELTNKIENLQKTLQWKKDDKNKLMQELNERQQEMATLTNFRNIKECSRQINVLIEQIEYLETQISSWEVILKTFANN